MQWANIQKLFGKFKRLHSSNCQFSNNCNTFIYGHEVEVAKKNGLPIVALESTIDHYSWNAVS